MNPVHQLARTLYLAGPGITRSRMEVGQQRIAEHYTRTPEHQRRASHLSAFHHNPDTQKKISPQRRRKIMVRNYFIYAFHNIAVHPIVGWAWQLRVYTYITRYTNTVQLQWYVQVKLILQEFVGDYSNGDGILEHQVLRRESILDDVTFICRFNVLKMTQ